LYRTRGNTVTGTVVPTIREVVVPNQSYYCYWHIGANSEGSKLYRIRAITVTGTMVPNLREVACTASELALLEAQRCQM